MKIWRSVGLERKGRKDEERKEGGFRSRNGKRSGATYSRSGGFPEEQRMEDALTERQGKAERSGWNGEEPGYSWHPVRCIGTPVGLISR